MGFMLDDVDVAMALVKPQQDPDNPSEDKLSWISLQASVGEASIIGIEGLTLSVTNFAVAVNQGGGTYADGSDNDTVIDYSQKSLEVNVGGGNSVVFDFVSELLRAEGSVSIGLFGFVYLSGNFAFEKKRASLRIVGQTEPVDVDMLTVGASGVDAFAGVNGPAKVENDDGEMVDNENAIGISIEDANLAMAMIKTTAPADPDAANTDLRSWMVVQAYVAEAAFIGVDDLTLSISELYVKVNQAGGTNGGLTNEDIIDFNASDFDLNGQPDNGLAINTGGGNTVNITNATYPDLFIKAEAQVDINIFGFFFASGSFAFEKSSTTITLDDGTSLDVERLAFGGSVSQAFAGVNGPYWTDLDENNSVNWVLPDEDRTVLTDGSDADKYVDVVTHDGKQYGDIDRDGVVDANESAELSEDAMGLALTGVNFGVAIMSPKAPLDPDVEVTDKRSWLSLKASVTGAEFVGVDGLTIAVRNLAVDINMGSGRNNGAVNRTVVDYTTYDNDGDNVADGYMKVNTGGGKSQKMDFTKPYLRVEGEVEIGVFDFFYVSGSFAFEKTQTTVNLSDGTTKKVELLTIGASVKNAFAGVNGPYWTDLDGDDDINWVLPDEDRTVLTDGNDADTFVDVVTHDDGKQYGDINEDGKVDANETAELSEEAMGLSLTQVKFGLALMKPTAPADPNVEQTDKRSWIAMKASVGQAAFVGIDGLTIELNEFSVKINQGSGTNNGVKDTDTVVDFTGQALPVNIGGGTSIGLDFQKALIVAEGNIKLSVFGFFFVEGDFAFEKSTTTITLDTGEEVDVDLITLGAGNVNAFAGMNGPGDQEDAVGLNLEDVDFGLALMKAKVPSGADPEAPTDKRSWTALRARVGEASFIGVDGLTLAVRSLNVSINQGSGTDAAGVKNTTVVDFGRYDPDGSGKWSTGDTGVDAPPAAEAVAANVTVPNPGENNDLTFTAVTPGTAFNDVTVEYVSGVAPGVNYDAAAKKLTVTVVSGVTRASEIIGLMDGVPQFTATAAEAAATGVITVPERYMTVNTGPSSSIDLGFREELLQVKGNIEINLFGFVYLSGNFAIEKTNKHITLTNNERFKAEVLTIGAGNVEAFAGINGPYFTDLDGDGVPSWTDAEGNTLTAMQADEDGDGVVDANETAELNEESIGLYIGDLDFGLAVIKKKADPASTEPPDERSWIGMQGTIREASLVGIEEVQISVQNFGLFVNKGSGGAEGAVMPVVDFQNSDFNDDGNIEGSLAVLTGIDPDTQQDTFVYMDMTEDIIKLDGRLEMTILEQTMSANFAFQQTTNEAGGNIIIIAVTQVNFSFLESDIISITNGEGMLVITPGGLAGRLSVEAAFDADIIAIDAEPELAFSTADIAVYEEIEIQGEVEILDLPAGPYFRIGVYDIDIDITGIGDDRVNAQGKRIDSDLHGNLQFEYIKIDEVVYIRVAATDIYANLADQGELTNGRGAFLFTSAGVAGWLKGSASITAGPLAGEGDAALRINTTGGPVDQKISVNGQELHILFVVDPGTGIDEGQFFAFELLDATIKIGDFLTLSGSYSVRSETRIDGNGVAQPVKIIAAANVDLFIGAGPYELEDGSLNPDAIGLLMKGADLAVLFYTADKYAFVADADQIGLVGIDGLQIEGSLSARVNMTGGIVDEKVTIGEGTPEAREVIVNFPTAQKIESIEGSLKISVFGIFSLSGTVKITRLPTTKELKINIRQVALSITVSGKEVFAISGAAAFTIGGTRGFSLDNFRINGFSLFGVTVGSTSTSNVPEQPESNLLSAQNGKADLATLNTNRYIDVVYSDPNELGINSDTVDGNEFTLSGPGATGVTLTGRVDHVLGTTYRYYFDGFFKEGEVLMAFSEGGVSDYGGNRSLGYSQTFYSVGAARAPPGANLANPTNGAIIDAKMLNARKYIDVTFTDRSGKGLNKQTIESDPDAEFTLSGPGLGDIKLGPLGEILDINGAVVKPTLVSGSTYRYYLTDKDPTNTTGLFANGDVIVNYKVGTWADNQGTLNKAGSEKFTIKAETSGSSSTTEGIKLGPLYLNGPSIGFSNFSFKDKKLNVTIGIGVETAGLQFGGGEGQSSSGITAELQGVMGTFDIAVDVMALMGSGGGGPAISSAGGFTFSVASLFVEVPNLLKAKATGIKIGYDPGYDPAEHDGLGQELVVIDSASLTIIPLKLTGSLKPYTYFDSGLGQDVTIPGLVIRTTGFKLGVAELCFGCVAKDPAASSPAVTDPTVTDPNDPNATPEPTGAINLLGIVEFDDIRVGVTNFGVDFRTGIQFDGEIYFASGGARFFPNLPINATISDRTTGEPVEDDLALYAAITFTDGKVDGFVFEVDTFEVDFAGFLVLKAQDFRLNTGAAAHEELVSFRSIGAELNVGPISVGGEARNFAFLGDGTFVTKKGFGVFLSLDASGDSMGFPSFLPIQISQFGIEWEDINNHPEDFTLSLSASITEMKGVPGLKFSGVIEGLKIRPMLLLQGKFPIIDITSIGISVEGEVFGGSISGALIGGILKLDANGQMIQPTDTVTPVADRVLFLGVQGGFEFPGIGGMNIRFAISELGPLGVFLNIQVPGGVILEPHTGLAINDFSAGVEFFKSLPSIEDARQLRLPAFKLPTETTAVTWLDEVKQQVVKQYNLMKGMPPGLGFFAAFKAPMLITGSAKIYTAYASDATFNGQVTVMFSTDGKFLINGKLNFAADNISVSGKLYADISKVASGQVTVLFLVEVPEQIRLLTLYGKLQIGFKMSNGDDFDIPVVYASHHAPVDTSIKPEAGLIDPAEEAEVDIGVFNDRTYDDSHYLDVTFNPGPGKTLDYASIMDSDREVSIKAGGNTYTLSGTPVPVTLAPDENGLPTITTVERNEGESDDAYYARLSGEGIQNFRYTVDDAAFTGYEIGEVEVIFAAGGFAASDEMTNDQKTQTFTVMGTTAVLASPQEGATVSITQINGQGYVEISFYPSYGNSLDLDSIDGDELSFNGPPGSTAVLDTSRSPEAVNERGYIDITYALPEGAVLDEGSITDLEAEFTLEGAGLVIREYDADGALIREEHKVSLDDTTAPELIEHDEAANTYTYRYWVTGHYESGIAGIRFVENTWAYTDSDGSIEDNPASAATESIDNPTTINTNSFRYYFTGEFAAGQAEVVFAEGSIDDDAGRTNFAFTRTFTVEAIGVALESPQPGKIAGLSNLNVHRGFIDVPIKIPSGGVLDQESVTDLEAEFTLTGGLSGVSLDADRAPILLGVNASTNTYLYRYFVKGTYASGAAGVSLIALSFFYTDASGTEVQNAADNITVSDPSTANLMYLDVVFRPAEGYRIDPDSVLDEEDEFILSGSGMGTAALDPTRSPTRIPGSNTYRYYLTGAFEAGDVSVEFVAGQVSLADYPDLKNLGSTMEFSIAVPTTALADPLAGAQIDRDELNDRNNGKSYIDVSFTPVNGNSVDAGSVTDPGAEFDIVVESGSGLSVARVEQLDDTTFRYHLNGAFEQGMVKIEFIEGSWQDSKGNTNLADTQVFYVTAFSASLFFEISGGV